MPDGLSEIFFARDLDRANQLDAAGKFSFEAQRRGRPQRVNPAAPPPRYWSAAPARRPPCTSVSTSAAAPIFGEVADADVAQYGSPRAEQAPGRSSLSLKMGTRRPDVLRHRGLRSAEVGFVRLAAHCFPVSNRRKCERTNGRRRGVDPLFEADMLRMARVCKRSVVRRDRGLSLTGKTTMARPAILAAYDLRLADDAIGREVPALPTKPARRRAGAYRRAYSRADEQSVSRQQ